MDLLELKASVVKILVMENDFTSDEAEEAVNEAAADKPDLWSENADPKDLANFLASDEDDE